MAHQDAIQRKHERLTAETNDYFWHTCPELSARWRQAMLTLSPSILQDLSVELQGLEVVTDRASDELRKAHVGPVAGGEPAEDLLDRALASMENLSEAADTMTPLLDELLND
jgi:hypothetical protein